MSPSVLYGFIVVVCCCLAACTTTKVASETSLSMATGSFLYAPPDNLLDTSKKLSLWATYYHVWFAETIRDSGFVLLDVKGQALTGKLKPRDWCMAGLEGTVQVKDSTGDLITYNYAGRGQDVQVDCAPFFNKGKLINPVAIGKTRWTRARGQFGDGVYGLILVPYRTIAVDTTFLPIGSVVYIPGARGVIVQLPDGKRVPHDGYFFAGDIGGAIKQHHIDVFSGVSTTNPFPAVILNTMSGVFEAYRVTDEHIIKELREQHIFKQSNR